MASLGEGGPPRVTPSRECHPSEKKLWLNLERTPDKRRRKVGDVTRRQLNKVIILQRAMTRKSCQFFWGKNVTLWVVALGDTNPSDASGCWTVFLEQPIPLTYLRNFELTLGGLPVAEAASACWGSSRLLLQILLLYIGLHLHLLKVKGIREKNDIFEHRMQQERTKVICRERINKFATLRKLIVLCTNLSLTPVELL